MKTTEDRFVAYTGGSQLAELFRAGRCRKLNIESILPEALRSISQDYLARTHPELPVRLAGKDTFGLKTRLSELVRAIGDAPESDTSDFAIVGLPAVSETLQEQLESMAMFSSWRKIASIVWIGPTAPRLHLDGWDNVLIQLDGRKRFTVYDPECSRYIPRGSILAKEQKHGRATNREAGELVPYEGWLEAGEMLLLPCGALHALAGSRDSVSLNCFLDGGPPPLYQRYRLEYFWKITLPEHLSLMVPRPVAVWINQKMHLPQLIARQLSKSVYPRKFRRLGHR